MKKAIMVFSSISLFVVIFISSPSFSQSKMDNNKTMAMENASSIHSNMRQLWSEHVMWTRNVILCIVDELPGMDQAVKRLHQNQTDIGNAIKTYYGDQAGNRLTDLLTNHINISVDVVKAAKSRNTTVLAEANKNWYANADEIAVLLFSANPIWKYDDVKTMMNEHLRLTTNEAIQRINKDYDADVAAFDKVYKEILQMSDMLAEGISKQFPSRTKTTITK